VYINDAMVTVADIEADNGVVHVIDAVLLPPLETSLDQNSIENVHIDLYPNPANDYIHIAINNIEFKGLKVRIINASGTVYNEFVMNSTNERLDVSSLSPGLYYMVISGNDSVRSSKFIISR
ncbi:MAG: T9SS type A sorting domain-containing protein, partial [Bacteroidales bacterium]|nr:T9SS type A sorting domain-containing protein [Bacteroidales bacterium]